MGCGPFGRHLSITNSYQTDPINPNPFEFRVLIVMSIGTNIVAEIEYPNCINFEGKKILVFENMSMVEFSNQVAIDPHFSSGSKLIARFVPTEYGWARALECADGLIVQHNKAVYTGAKFTLHIKDYRPNGKCVFRISENILTKKLGVSSLAAQSLELDDLLALMSKVT